jgi:RNA polymerase sigma factor (sigma-70 family)
MRLAFGPEPSRVPKEREREADFDARVESIWPFLMSMCSSFVERLSPSERQSLDLDDVLSEAFVRLKEKDHCWNPDRGRYITFAGSVVRRMLYDLRDRSRTVKSPSNSSIRSKAYEEKAATTGGVANPIWESIAATKREYVSINGVEGGVDIEDHGPPAEDEAKESRDRDVAKKLKEFIGSLTPYQAAVVGMEYGLFGQPTRTVAEIAERLKIDVVRCRSISASAKNRMKKKGATTEGL